MLPAPAFHSLRDQSECQGRVSESQDGPRRTNKTKWLHSVSCPGFMFGVRGDVVQVSGDSGVYLWVGEELYCMLLLVSFLGLLGG